MSGTHRLLIGLVVAFCLAAAGTASAYHTQFIANNCNYAAPTPTSSITRDGSATVALRARYEGYQWGGGHFRNSPLSRDGAL